jgi:hypothetical protein
MDVAASPKSVEQAAKWLNQDAFKSGRKLEVDDKWILVSHLARFGHPEAKNWQEKMKRLDPSDRGKRSLLQTEAVVNDPAVKRRWIDVLKQPRLPIPFAEATFHECK